MNRTRMAIIVSLSTNPFAFSEILNYICFTLLTCNNIPLDNIFLNLLLAV